MSCALGTSWIDTPIAGISAGLGFFTAGWFIPRLSEDFWLIIAQAVLLVLLIVVLNRAVIAVGRVRKPCLYLLFTMGFLVLPNVYWFFYHKDIILQLLSGLGVFVGLVSSWLFLKELLRRRRKRVEECLV